MKGLLEIGGGEDRRGDEQEEGAEATDSEELIGELDDEEKDDRKDDQHPIPVDVEFAKVHVFHPTPGKDEGDGKEDDPG